MRLLLFEYYDFGIKSLGKTKAVRYILYVVVAQKTFTGWTMFL